ncbi:hypothetical protein WA026_023634 [Henosepilachna vigintioctopunctata]|uniref:Uncharacterized protein n=1 Tax=Henosepilachna vigintioctopunctata TaxID=420089 RepID=A0AAW1UK57_9CUCU
MELHLSDLWERNHRRSLDRTDKQIVVYYSAQDTTWRMMNSAMCPHPDFYDLQLFPVMDGIEGLVDSTEYQVSSRIFTLTKQPMEFHLSVLWEINNHSPLTEISVATQKPRSNGQT